MKIIKFLIRLIQKKDILDKWLTPMEQVGLALIFATFILLAMCYLGKSIIPMEYSVQALRVVLLLVYGAYLIAYCVSMVFKKNRQGRNGGKL